jgi:16S rRNA G1207 methylase RsmC
MVIPEGLGQLRRQLSSVARLLSGRNATGTPVIGGAMTRDVHRSTSRAFESSIGPTATSLARRRARLVRAEFAPKVAAAVPAVVEQRIAVHLPSAGSGSRTATLIAVPGTFGDRRLDEGASLMVSALADGAEGGRGASAGWGRVVDLGSGTGVLGLAAIGLGAARVAFIDDADSAVASTRMTIEANEWAQIAAVTHVVGAHSLPAALDEIGWDAFDTLLCNPPFHHGRVQGPDVAEEMFAQAAARLAPDGTAWVVGNRHLGYHRTLRRWFGEVEVAASNPRFVVLRAAGQKRVRGG